MSEKEFGGNDTVNDTESNIGVDLIPRQEEQVFY